MNHTVKVTGFTWQYSVRQKLLDLFCRVGQVQEVYFSQDKNASFIRFEYRSAVQFALDQEWLLGRATLKVRAAAFYERVSSPARQPLGRETQNLRPVVLAKRDSTPASQAASASGSVRNDTLGADCRLYHYSHYHTARSKFWADVPHERFTMPSKPQKGKRKSCSDLLHFSAPKAGKHPKKLKKKPKKKKKSAYLECAASLPFGVTPSVEETREVFVKGHTTVNLSIPWTATASDILSLVAGVTQVPTQHLHVTCEGCALSDDKVALILDGSTLHYTIKGLGGADDGEGRELRRKAEDMKDYGNERYKEGKYEEAVAFYTASIAMFPLVATYNNRAQCYICLSKWEESIQDCIQVLLREPTNMKALLRRGTARKSKGDFELAEADLAKVQSEGPPSLSQQASSLLQELEADKLAKKNEPSEQGLSKKARKRLRKKAKKAGQDNAQEVQEETATEDNQAEVLGIEKMPEAGKGKPATCPTSETAKDGPSGPSHVTDTGAEGLHAQPGSGGQTITPSSSVEEVKHWLQSTCKLADNHLHYLTKLDGEVLFEYERDVSMLASDTRIPVGVARKIMFLRDNPRFHSRIMNWDVEKVKAFISEVMTAQDLSKVEENHIDGPAFLSYQTVAEVAQDFKVKKRIAFQILASKQKFLDDEREGKVSEESDHGDHTLAPADSTEQRFCEPQKSASPPASTGSNARCVELKEDDPFSAYKLYIQNKLNLQPLEMSSQTPAATSCELRVIYHKRKGLNALEKQFMFLILCKPEFCKGKEAKGAREKLWTLLVDRIDTVWIKVLPPENIDKFSSLSFDNQQAKLSNIIEFETVRKLDECPPPILIVDRNLLVEGSVGYTLPLKKNKVTCAFPFGFLEGVQYWLFDSSDFAQGFEEKKLDTSVLGTSARLQYVDRSPMDTTPETLLTEGGVSEKLCHPSMQDDVDKCSEHDSVAPSVPPLSTVGDVSTSQTSEEYDKDASATDYPEPAEVDSDATFICPRDFKRGNWKYNQGILRAVESGDNMLSRAVEFKFQAGCSPEDPVAFRSFLYKSLEFVCACLNSRKNGTIYFGVAEKRVKEQIFQYGEIHGIEMDQDICAQYYDAFYSEFLEKCFPSHYEYAKLCITGPVFIPVRNTNRYVIEIDIEPEYEQTKDTLFYFYPKAVFQKYGYPAKSETAGPDKKKEKHVYLKNQDNWTGIFRRDGSQTIYLNEEKKHTFERIVLPELCKKRKQEEVKAHASKVDMNSPEADKLKQFICECDSSMFPILLLPKLTEKEKKESIEFFEFHHYIRWSAVFDFDDESERNGLYGIAKSTNLAFEVHESVATDFKYMSVEDRKDNLLFPKKTVWLFANGKTTGDNAFERLCLKEWKNKYWTYIKNAVAFYKDNSVIPPQRRLVLILVADEISDGIMEVSQDIKTDFGWENVFFVFQSESVRQLFAEELSDDLMMHSVVMPWQHAHYLICQCLKLKSQDEDKYVCTSSGAPVPIPFNEWKAWTDLDVLSVEECKKEWDACTQNQRDLKSQKEEERFYQGKPVSWLNFHFTDFYYNHVMERTICSKLMNHIEDKIKNAEGDIESMVTIAHMPGAGGTTLGKALLWKLKEKYKCAVLKSITLDTERQIIQFWESVEKGQDQTYLPPVILLADNLASDISQFELNRRLYRRHKEMQLARPLAILIHCYRTMKGDDKFLLPQKLTDPEEVWMKKKCEDLEKQRPGDVGTFIGFLAMRNGYDQRKLQDTIVQYLDQHVLDENERQVIEYVSLITTYFPSSKGSPGLPVTSFDGIMKTFKTVAARTLPWEKTLSKNARVMLIIEDCCDPYRIKVRIANQPYARALLKTSLEKNSETLGDIVIRCLNSPLVLSTKDVNDILTQMIIERHIDDESADQTHMSPLIMEIRDKDFDKAVEVLEVGYMRLKNEVFYQQLARLYMNEAEKVAKLSVELSTEKQSFELARLYMDKAEKVAKRSVELSPENRIFKHTLGVVYLKKFTDMKDHFTAEKESISSEPLKVANLALKSFIEAKGNMDHDVVDICFASANVIEIVIKILQFLFKSIPVDTFFRLGRYLTEDGYSDSMFSSLQDTERQLLKELVREGFKALRFMFYVTYSNSLVINYASSFQSLKDKRTMDNVNTMCVKRMSTFSNCVGKLRLGNSEHIPNIPKEDNYLRFKNVYLKGCFFESIFLQVGSLHSSKHEETRKEIRQKLQEVMANLEAIEEKTFIDMDNLMTVYLALEIIGEKHAFSSNKAEIYGFCNKIIQSRLEPSDTCHMRAHLYRVFVSWPEKYWDGFHSDDFKRSFQHKSPSLQQRKEPLLPKIHFYVTKESETRPFVDCYFCHWTELYEDAEKEVPPFDVMRKRLKTFTGSYKFRKNREGEQFSSIEMKWQCAHGELSLTVWKIRGEKVFREEQVEFYLGFSLRGPVAIIHRVLMGQS